MCIRDRLWATVVAVARTEGFGGFWRGVLPRTGYMAIGGMVYLGTYSYCSEALMRVLGPSPRDRDRDAWRTD